MTHTKRTRRPLDVPALADEVAESVRRLNHALQDAAGRGEWPMPPQDAYRVVGALADTARRLPQVLRETTGFAYEPDGLRVDDGTDPAAHLRRLSAAVHDATQHARVLEAALNEACSLVGAVGYAVAWDDA
ncbi:hypothetical protein [Yinghuangia sp. YIM S10712]|uniref:hypothetical protein n=1 Tax=Yinghuangia sp. YIM S10712 TaxID=3436930 RepID=UPI003F52E988